MRIWLHFVGVKMARTPGVRLMPLDNSNICDLRGSDRDAIVQSFEYQTHLTPDIALYESIRTTS